MNSKRNVFIIFSVIVVVIIVGIITLQAKNFQGSFFGSEKSSKKYLPPPVKADTKMLPLGLSGLQDIECPAEPVLIYDNQTSTKEDFEKVLAELLTTAKKFSSGKKDICTYTFVQNEDVFSDKAEVDSLGYLYCALDNMEDWRTPKPTSSDAFICQYKNWTADLWWTGSNPELQFMLFSKYGSFYTKPNFFRIYKGKKAKIPNKFPG